MESDAQTLLIFLIHRDKYDAIRRSPHKSVKYIEDIQMFLLNMAFISSSEGENIYLYLHIFHFTSEIKAIFNKNSFEFYFIIYNHMSKEVHMYIALFSSYPYFWLCPLTMNMRAC